jgi:curved DNA-binding protein CbpA
MHSGRGVTETSPGSTRWRAAQRSEGTVSDDPFALLGLPTRPGLSDDDVRAAWRRIAAATHPDREDGGDPARFGAAAGAYVVLRTGFGRGEALADLGLSATPDPGGRHAHRSGRPPDGSARGGRHRAGRETPVDRRLGVRLPRLTWQNRRPGGLALRVACAAAVGVVAVVISGWSPGVVGVLAGVLTWLLATARHAFTRRRSQ